jgi:hypothetical protein
MTKLHLPTLFMLTFIWWGAACNGRSPTPPSPSPPTPTQAALVIEATAVSPNPTPDRSPFHPNLTTAEQANLDDLTTAPTYEMSLTIEPDLGTLTGRQTIHYTNNSDEPLADFYLHLLPNLLGGAIAVDNVRVNGRFLTPLYEALNNSMMRLPLRDPLPPGAQALIEMDFVTAVPQELGPNYGVFAQSGGVMALAHFFPLLSVYDATGWNTEAAVPYGDPTYAEAAFYLVEVVAPSDQVVVGSGVTLEQSDDGQTQQHILAAGPARDFYLALSPDYEKQTLTVGEITINSYAPPELAAGAAQALEVAASALQFFGEQFGPYPYTELDIVATPTLALGIEYPGVIAITQREYNTGDPLRNYLETTVVHEVAHQWFYNLVGNDQLDEPWLDEALAQYATWLYLVDQYGEEEARFYRESWNGRWQQSSSAPTPIGLPVSAYEGAAYSAIIYGRGPLFLLTLSDEMGQAVFADFLQQYTAQHAWGIATTESFRQTAESTCQCDLAPLFQEWVYGIDD